MFAMSQSIDRSTTYEKKEDDKSRYVRQHSAKRHL